MKGQVNYLYFGFFFSLLSLLCISSISLKEGRVDSFFFFFLYVLGQALIETFSLVALTSLIQYFLGKIALKVWIGLCFLLIFFHIFDFLMDRILDLSAWEAFNLFVFQEELGNFFLLLDASGVSLPIWGLIFLSILLLPILGNILYSLTAKLSNKKPLATSNGHFFQAFFCIPAALFLWDFSASHWIAPDSYTNFKQSLPWKRTFLEPKTARISLVSPLQPPQEKEVSSFLDQDQTALKNKPNIYLIIAESLREDCITEKITPALHRFKQDFFHFDRAISSGNGTHLSWFSIFFSQPALYWKICSSSFEKGSFGIRLLKKWGYQVRLYSSAQLSYYNMEKLLFGQNSYLLDSKKMFHHAPPLKAADSDALALATMQSDLEKNSSLKEGQLIVLFWDSTHFDYSWPKNWAPKFTPFAKESAYFKMFYSEKSLEAMKHRYMNSLNYLDHLFGLFMSKVQEDDIVIFLGDHGEEFFEHGHLFHNSHLSKEQTHIPLYLKLGTKAQIIKNRPLISQVDIFPTLADYLAEKSIPFFTGDSVLRQKAFPLALTARFNAGSTPYEMSIDQDLYKMIVRFSNKQDILKSNELKIVSLKDKEGLPLLAEEIKERFAPFFTLFSQVD